MTAKEKLDLLGEKWCAGRDAMSGEQRLIMQETIFLVIDDVFSKDKNYPEGIGEFFCRDWPAFDTEKGKLSSYARARLEYRAKEAQHKDREDHYVNVKDPDEGKPKREWVYAASLNQSIDPDNTESAELVDLQNDGTAEAAFSEVSQPDWILVQLLSLILALPSRLNGRANNPQRLRYYRMFFTDDSVEIIHSQPRITAYIEHERDLFQALHLGFLDFFMTRKCRSVIEISNTARKLLGELIDGENMITMDHPLPNDVYLAYIRAEVGTSAGSRSVVSEMRGNYRKFFAENGLC